MKIVLIGASAGGVSSLQTVLLGLPHDFPAPIVIVQHRSSHSRSALSTVLGRCTALPVRDITGGEALERGVSRGHVHRETSEHFGMPGAAIDTGAVEQVLGAHDIAPAIVHLTQ